MSATDPVTKRSKPKQQPQKPIEKAIRSWAALQQHIEAAYIDSLVTQGPKRWVVYSPMILLPSGSFCSEQWSKALGLSSKESQTLLWRSIIAEISKKSNENPTHLAVNEGIPLQNASDPGSSDHHPESEQSGTSDTLENVLRSPSGLRILYGDFGSAELQSASGVTQAELEAAFWVSTRQNGITQVWAPRWTMFSRGNIKEKARLLDFHQAPVTLASPAVAPEPASVSSRVPSDAVLRRRVQTTEEQACQCTAIDLYAGIGYFVFSYATQGSRVLCWELNPWSVEGLRRGAIANKWTVRVIRGDELQQVDMASVLKGGEQIIVFEEDNRKARPRLLQLGHEERLQLSHVNCGFLPTSAPVWKDAWGIDTQMQRHWMHLHENLGIRDIESRKLEIQRLFDEWARNDPEEKRRAEVEHVELVKTFAPDVWHCVFDIYIYKVD